jgi:hypothetical protein
MSRKDRTHVRRLRRAKSWHTRGGRIRSGESPTTRRLLGVRDSPLRSGGAREGEVAVSTVPWPPHDGTTT